jgi:DNA-binding transcriptional regulator YhcF (GntR family)
MLLSLDEASSVPIYLQITQQIKEQILLGHLRPGEEIPSVREVADDLGISLHTVRSAYQTLNDAGLLHIRLGRRARVSESPANGTDGGRWHAAWERDLRGLVIDGLLLGMSGEELTERLQSEVESVRRRREGGQTR